MRHPCVKPKKGYKVYNTEYTYYKPGDKIITMKKKLILPLILHSLIFISAFTKVSAAEYQCPYGCPIGTNTDSKEISNEIFRISMNPETKFADWATYTVRPEYIGRTQKRVWKADPRLPDEYQMEPSDYKGAWKTIGTDRGHLVPLASFTNTPYWTETNYLTNIAPQRSDLNRNSWLDLENAVRKLVYSMNIPVTVATGTLYEKQMPDLPGADEEHSVPSHYWKTVAIEYQGSLHTASFVYPQSAGRNTSHCDYVTNVIVVETLAKHDINPVITMGTNEDSRWLLQKLGCRQ